MLTFLVDYVAQAGLLTAAFYFIYHTTSPLLVDWASGGQEKSLTFEFDFSYFYSSMLAVLAMGLLYSLYYSLYYSLARFTSSSIYKYRC